MADAMLQGLRQRLAEAAHLRETRRLRRSHPLRYLFLELTRGCNRACVYCGSDCTPAPGPGELSAGEWIDVLRQVAADFDSRRVMLAFTGGEPLLVSGLLEVFAEARRHGFPFGMVSNGGLITSNTARRLVASGIGSISLSLDAPPDLNDGLRGRGATHAVERAVAHLREAGFVGRLEIISTVTRPCVPRLDQLRGLVARLRVAEWRLAPVIPIGRAARRPELLLDAEDLWTLLEFVRRGRADGRLPVPEFGDECYLGPRFEGEVRPYRFQCRAGVTVAGIHADGRIGACPELGPGFVQGDVRRERLRDVWAERYEIFRDRGWTQRGNCGSCGVFAVCQGGSLHAYPAPGEAPRRCLYLMLRSRGLLESAAEPPHENGPGSGSSPLPGPEDRTSTEEACPPGVGLDLLRDAVEGYAG